MSLATTCPACGTCFRVVQDQLKVSEGWVRCGHCQEVFNAMEGLFDLEAALRRASTNAGAASTSEISPRPGEEAGHTAVLTPPPEREAGTQRPDGGDFDVQDVETAAEPGFEAGAAAVSVDVEPWHKPFEAQGTDLSAATVAAAAQRSPPGTPSSPGMPSDDAGDRGAGAFIGPTRTVVSADDQIDDVVPQETAAGTPEPAQADAAATAPRSEDAASTVADPMPEFVRVVQRRARWESPLARVALSAAAFVAALLLVGQAAFHWRDRLAAVSTSARAVLEPACEVLGCTLQPPKVLDALVVENSALSHPPGTGAYQLDVTVRNGANYPVAPPHLELSLSDGQGAVVARRVISPDDFHLTAQDAIRAQSEVIWSLRFSAATLRVAGYTVAAFYP